ncbi:MFS transporter [Rouxiella sp. T17]|uniref:MFS transporter n=1 Tax=Rouxiella sp. T17 TaxID=3085684 RepID=UPI002FC68377
MKGTLFSMTTKVVLLAALIQLVNALDFMMIMPLGPDLARELAISPTWVGYLGGGYTLAAAISSLVAAKFIDRFDRKHVTLVALAGLSLATLKRLQAKQAVFNKVCV